MKKKSHILSILFFLSTIINAQSDSTLESKVQFKLSVNYNSGFNYYGRRDSLKSSGFFPLAEIWFSPHFYLNAAPVLINNRVQSFKYAGTITTLGYQQITKKWFTNIYLMKPFYEQSSQLVQSSLKGQAGINLSYLNSILNISAGTDVKYSDKTDFGASAGADHIFRIQNKDNSVIIMDPSLTLYAGTQNFTNSYYQKNPGFLLLPGTSQQVNENVQQFNLLAIEVSSSIIYTKSKWQIIITPAYIMPKNLVSIPGRPDLSEKGDALFYCTAGIKRMF